MINTCRCGRPTNKHGKACCQMCWISKDTNIIYGHSRLCRQRKSGGT